jgi:hypothetical protein
MAWVLHSCTNQTQNMEPEIFTETSVTIYQYTWRHIPEDSAHRQHRCTQRNSRKTDFDSLSLRPKTLFEIFRISEDNGIFLYHDFVSYCDDEARVISVFRVYFWPPAWLIVQSRPTRRLQTCEISLKATYTLNTFMFEYSNPVGLANT